MLLVKGDMFPLEFKGLERCVICLSDENENESQDDLQAIPVNVFNKVWNHLVVGEKRDERSFSRTPPVCVECRRSLEKLFGLLIQVEQVTNGIRAVVTDTGKNGSFAEQRFFKMLEDLKDNRLEDKWRRSTLNLLEQLGHGEIREEDYQNWFNEDDKVISDDETINSLVNQEGYDEDECSEDDIKMIPNCEDGPGDEDEIKMELDDFYNETSPAVNSSADDPLTWNNPTCQVPLGYPPGPEEPPATVEKQPVKQIFITLIPPQPKVQRVLKCDLCKDLLPFKREADLIAHKIKCHDTVPFECQYCGRKFARMNALQQHEHFHTNINIPQKTKFICDIPGCGQICVTQKKLELHKLSVKHAGKMETFVCIPCGKGFNTEDNLKSHQRHKHPNVKTVPCKDCKECFKTLEELRKHIVTHADIRPFACSICGLRFRKNVVLQRHLQRHKDNDNIQKSKVLNKPKFICDISGCGKIYASKKQLEQHKMSVEHLGRTNAFICNDCGKGFNLEKHLAIHVRTAHPAERKFCCEECGESFKTENVLQNHKLIHTGERPFVCDLCGQRFRQKVVLRRHLQGHKEKGENFKPNGPMKGIRKRVNNSN